MIAPTRLARPTPPANPAILPPNPPQALVLAQGPGGDLTATWEAPAGDSTHGAATGCNVRWSLSGAAAWTVLADVATPCILSGLPAGAAIDVQVQAVNAAGTGAWSATGTLTTASGPAAPHAPVIAAIAAPPDGTNSRLTVTWSPPAVDGSHGAATGYNLRYSSAGAGTWTTVTGVTSPYTIDGLPGGAAIDVAVQASNAAPSPGPWSTIAAGTTWSATVVPGAWTAATEQVHGTGVAPNGGVNMFVTAGPTAVAGAALAWSTSPSVRPTSGLIAAGPIGQPDGWGQYFEAPAIPGTWYIWMLGRDLNGATIGALVTSAITVS